MSYKVPDYQRRFSWGNEQLEALWSDLFESYQNDISSFYFLGSIVAVQNKDKILELIDGQQRLTTLMILTNVLVKTFPDIECPNPINPEDDASLINTEILRGCIFYREGKKRLTLQTATEYDTDFNANVINYKDFSSLAYPSKKEIGSENPKFNFIFAARFFYDKFVSLSEADMKKFVFFIFNQVKLIRITCYSVPFAIKLFQVLNDRGMPLSSSDIIKSYIMGRIFKDGEKERIGAKFASNWKALEKLATDYDFKLDDFMVYYEYFKLRSNPKRQVVDELKAVIENEDIEIENIVDEMKLFADNLEEILKSNDTLIYSLMYLPWPTYIISCLTAAWFCKYGIKKNKNEKNEEIFDFQNRDKLIALMRRYFYLAFVSGKTLNQIKQTSFRLLFLIADQKPIEEIEDHLNASIKKNKMIRGTNEALKDDLFGECFLKPLLLSIEYEIREKTNTSFTEIDHKLHVDHILPQAFASDADWDYIDKNQAAKFMDKLGNMALLNYQKNEEALNKGFAIKCRIYQGQGADGKKSSGVTCFDSTREIVSLCAKGNPRWTFDDIQRRSEVQRGRIEKMLGISEEFIEQEGDIPGDAVANKKRMARFNFSELEINIGEKLFWFDDPSVFCTVFDEHEVIFNGEKKSLSSIATERAGYNTHGALYFCYRNKTISDIRAEKESQT